MLVVCAVIATATLTSCTRQTQQQMQTQSQLIVGKWTLKTALGNYTTQGDNHKDTTQFTTADYFEFKADGTLAIMETGKAYNGNWKITNNTLFITNTQYLDYTNGLDISSLTATDLKLHYVEVTTLSTLEQTLILKK
jgi:hypothetical protein